MATENTRFDLYQMATSCDFHVEKMYSGHG